MDQIDNVTNNPNQLINFVLADGSEVLINLVYRPTVQAWTMDLVFADTKINSLRVCVHPNFLREYRNVLPFGLACTSTDGIDPVYLDDFVNGRCSLFVLSQADVLEIESTYFGPGVE